GEGVFKIAFAGKPGSYIIAFAASLAPTPEMDLHLFQDEKGKHEKARQGVNLGGLFNVRAV
ncbi:MAG TPA: hypothetical protein DIW52_21725, partial [Pseudomonas sp.]|nr:hypothetical protein [Pseudomonas sp.]